MTKIQLQLQDFSALKKNIRYTVYFRNAVVINGNELQEGATWYKLPKHTQLLQYTVAVSTTKYTIVLPKYLYEYFSSRILYFMKT